MRILTILAMALAICVVAGCTSGSQGSGTLSGHIDIGPLQPVIREGELEPTPAPEVYAAWQIVVFTEDGRRELARVGIGPGGDYQIILPEGTYKVTAEPVSGGGLGQQQEYIIDVVNDRITKLDVGIDTGIR